MSPLLDPTDLALSVRLFEIQRDFGSIDAFLKHLEKKKAAKEAAAKRNQARILREAAAQPKQNPVILRFQFGNPRRSREDRGLWVANIWEYNPKQDIFGEVVGNTKKEVLARAQMLVDALNAKY